MTGKAAKVVPNTGGSAKGMRGPRIAPMRCNICSLFSKRKVIKVKGHKCSEEAKKAVGAMNKVQLSRAVVKMLREAEGEEVT